ncbi:MAG TPA: DUF6800 family protein [Fimbriiglobus sp.]|jgi:hypothetical protein
MVERRIELDRRYHRKEKMRKLKKKLESAKGEDRNKLLGKIKRLSPFWTEASLTPPAAGGAPKTPKAPKVAKEGRDEPKKKAPPKKKPAAS